MDNSLIPLAENKPVSVPWSKALGSRLLKQTVDSAGRSEERERLVRTIALTPALRSEAQALLPQIEAAKRPAQRHEIVAVIAREMPAWGVGAKAAAEWGITYASYADALEGMPLYALEEAVLRWNRGEGQKDISAGGFPPRPAQLFKLAELARGELWMVAYRLRLVSEYVHRTGVEWTAERKAAERQKMIDAGYLNEDGSLAFTLKPREMPVVHSEPENWDVI